MDVMTRGVMAEDVQVRDRLMSQLGDERARTDDEFIKLNADGKDYYACMNEVGDYTIMRPEEY